MDKFTREQVFNLMKASYKRGFYNGVEAYAWWKDGKQRVGTTGTTFKEAVKKIDNEEHFNLNINFDTGNILSNFEQEQYKQDNS